MNVQRHRHFHVNGRLEFSVFYDETITDPETIIKEFHANHAGWKFMVNYCNWVLTSYEFDDTLENVYITTRE